MKKIVCLLMAVTLMISLIACGETNSTEETVIHIISEDDMDSMDVAQTTFLYFVPLNVFDRLFEVEVQSNGSVKTVKSLCDDYSVSDDGMTFSFKLKDGIVFSNGNTLTSADVKYTFERLLDIDFCNSDIAWEVDGAEEYVEKEIDGLRGFVVKDDLNFDITLSEPNAGFISELASPAMSIVDEETTRAAKNFGTDVNEAIGTGAYIITEWVENDHWTFEYNPKYWGDEPEVKHLVVDIVSETPTGTLKYQNGEADIVCLDNVDPDVINNIFLKNYSNQIIKVNKVALTYMALNANNKYLSNVLVRKAIQKAIDIDGIIEHLYGGDAIRANGIIPKGLEEHNDDPSTFVFDPEGAKSLIKEAGFAEGEITFDFYYVNETNSKELSIIQTIQSNLKDVGINMEPKPVDYTTYLDKRTAGELDSYVAEWLMDYNDPGNILWPFFGGVDETTERSLNYKETDVMDRVEAASSIVDDKARAAEYKALDKKIAVEDAAMVPMYETTSSYAISPKIKSFVPHWAGYTSTFFIKDIKLNK